MKAPILLALLATACTAQPAVARPLDQRIAEMPDEAWVTVGEFFLDGATTYFAVRDGAHEANPIARAFVGKHPNPGKLAGFAIGKSLLYLAGISALQDSNPKAARSAARVTMFIQAGVVGWNLKVAI